MRRSLEESSDLPCPITAHLSMIRHSTLHLSFLSFFYLVSTVLSFTAHFLFLTSNAIIILPVFGVIHRERIGSAWVSAPALYSPPSIRHVSVTGK